MGKPCQESGKAGIIGVSQFMVGLYPGGSGAMEQCNRELSGLTVRCGRKQGQDWRLGSREGFLQKWRQEIIRAATRVGQRHWREAG